MWSTFEEKALAKCDHGPMWWCRYVNNPHKSSKTNTVRSLQSSLTALTWTSSLREEVEDSDLAFLEMNIVQKEDGSLKFTVYHKKTHTYQYLSFKRNHLLIHKFGVVHLLHNRTESLVIEEADKEEKEHI